MEPYAVPFSVNVTFSPVKSGVPLHVGQVTVTLKVAGQGATTVPAIALQPSVAVTVVTVGSRTFTIETAESDGARAASPW